MENNYHETVMPEDAVNGLQVKEGHKYIDATLGNGGHVLEILKQGGMALGIDLDPEMVKMAEERLEPYKSGNWKLVHDNFTNIDEIAQRENWKPVDGILFDLGVSNIHLKDLERGFSFGNPEAPLDMRLDPTTQSVKGADLLNALREDQLREMFEVTMEPGPAKWVTGRVMFARRDAPIATVADLLEISEGLKTGKPGLSEATLPFLAVRIAVNTELDNLSSVLPKAFSLLEKGGRLVVISFHSKEDVIVKDFFKEKSLSGEAEMITFKPATASEEEIEKNRRARSAKMRIIQKI